MVWGAAWYAKMLCVVSLRSFLRRIKKSKIHISSPMVQCVTLRHNQCGIVWQDIGGCNAWWCVCCATLGYSGCAAEFSAFSRVSTRSPQTSAMPTNQLVDKRYLIYHILSCYEMPGKSHGYWVQSKAPPKGISTGSPQPSTSMPNQLVANCILIHKC